MSVFHHRDYRAFLREYYEHKKEKEYGFSYRSFARKAGLRSPNYLKLVIEGKRNLTSEMASRFAQACDLEGEAADYFCELVAFNQARSSAERSRCYRRLSKFKRYRRVYRLDAAHAAYYSQWYIPAIRELAMRADIKDDPAWIAKMLLPNITTKQAADALKVLDKLGLLVCDGKGGLKQAEPLVATRDDQVLGHHIANFHRSMMQRAAEAIDLVPREQREIASLTLCISEERMRELKEHLERIRAELLQLYQPDEEAKRVVQVNFQMFPLSVEED